jgi:fumarylacetoacetase
VRSPARGQCSLAALSGFGVLESGICWCDDADVIDLSGLGDVFAQPSLNALMALGRDGWAEALAVAQSHDGPRTPADEAAFRLPFEVADYVDFNSSLEHATNVGRLLRPDADPVRPNWRAMPVGYHGRSGTVVVSGTDVRRPHGRLDVTRFGPTERLDVELELGFVAGVPSRDPVRPEEFADHVFGVVLLNDWSARDIQGFEYQPLGPFLGKSFQTSISATVTPLALLEPARIDAPGQEPPPHAGLAGGRDWALDLDTELQVNGEVLARGNASSHYWTMPQQLAHLTSNGATLRTGDLMGTGTISGRGPGSLLELWQNERYLADGDEVVLRAGGHGVRLGDVRGRVLPAG